jgi:hypothetical protein
MTKFMVSLVSKNAQLVFLAANIIWTIGCRSTGGVNELQDSQRRGLPRSLNQSSLPGTKWMLKIDWGNKAILAYRIDNDGLLASKEAIAKLESCKITEEELNLNCSNSAMDATVLGDERAVLLLKSEKSEFSLSCGFVQDSNLGAGIYCHEEFNITAEREKRRATERKYLCQAGAPGDDFGYLIEELIYQKFDGQISSISIKNFGVGKVYPAVAKVEDVFYSGKLVQAEGIKNPESVPSTAWAYAFTGKGSRPGPYVLYVPHVADDHLSEGGKFQVRLHVPNFKDVLALDCTAK